MILSLFNSLAFFLNFDYNSKGQNLHFTRIQNTQTSTPQGEGYLQLSLISTLRKVGQQCLPFSRDQARHRSPGDGNLVFTTGDFTVSFNTFSAALSPQLFLLFNKRQRKNKLPFCHLLQKSIRMQSEHGFNQCCLGHYCPVELGPKRQSLPGTHSLNLCSWDTHLNSQEN